MNQVIYKVRLHCGKLSTKASVPALESPDAQIAGFGGAFLWQCSFCLPSHFKLLLVAGAGHKTPNEIIFCFIQYDFLMHKLSLKKTRRAGSAPSEP